MRFAVALLALFPLLARAHTFTFDFITPSGIGTRTDGGVTAVQWVDGPDPNDLAALTLYASRNGITPFLPSSKDVQFGPMGVKVSDPANVAVWDATAAPPGCYQPFVEMVDQIEGTTMRPSAGLITVNPADGGNRPPAIWVLNPETEKPNPDGGNFALRLRVVDPDDVGEVSVRWSDGADAGGTLVQGLPTSDGGGTLTYGFNPAALPSASVYFLQVEVKGFDGQRCNVWWSGYLPGNLPVDAGVADAGTEVPDAGPGPMPPPRGCGCEAGGGPMVLLALLLLRRAKASGA